MRFGVLLGLGMAAIGWSAEPAIADPTACGGRVHEIEGQNHLYVSKAEASCPWAFEVDEVVFSCVGGKKAELLVLTTSDETVYGFNGLAASMLKLPSVREIWSDDPELEGAKVSMAPWLDVARETCG